MKRPQRREDPGGEPLADTYAGAQPARDHARMARMHCLHRAVPQRSQT